VKDLQLLVFASSKQAASAKVARCRLSAMISRSHQRVVLWASVVWGVLMIGVGALASFTIESTDTPLTLIGFSLIFVLPLAASLAAWRMPRVAAIVILVSAVAALVCLARNWADVLQILSRIYLWLQVVFGVLFLAMSKVNQALEGGADAET
jgi:hypothetical protein